MPRMTFPVAVHLFLLKDDQILLLRRFNTGYEDGNYSVVAGHVDGGEDVYSAMMREAEEEAGIVLSAGSLKIVQVMHRKKACEERIDYFFTCDRWEGDARVMEPGKCDGLMWRGIDSLPDNTIDYIRAAVSNYLAGIPFSVYGW